MGHHFMSEFGIGHSAHHDQQDKTRKKIGKLPTVLLRFLKDTHIRKVVQWQQIAHPIIVPNDQK